MARFPRLRGFAPSDDSEASARGANVHPDLEEAIAFHEAIVAEGGKALVGYETAKTLANVVLLSEIPTTYDKKEQRQRSEERRVGKECA